MNLTSRKTVRMRTARTSDRSHENIFWFGFWRCCDIFHPDLKGVWSATCIYLGDISAPKFGFRRPCSAWIGLFDISNTSVSSTDFSWCHHMKCLRSAQIRIQQFPWNPPPFMCEHEDSSVLTSQISTRHMLCVDLVFSRMHMPLPLVEKRSYVSMANKGSLYVLSQSYTSHLRST